MVNGRCDCGKVSFQVETIRETITVCHCRQCRRTSGHLWAVTHASAFSDVTFVCDEGLAWYASSDFAKRGFCRFCGSSLFYRMNEEDDVGIAAGCLDQPTHARVTKHIFVKDKGDYYDIADDALQIERY